MGESFPAPTFGHAAEAFVIAHAALGAWSAGTAVKYRQTLAALGGQLAEIAPAAAGDVAVLGTQAGASAMEAAFTSAFGGLAPATRARHLSALCSRAGLVVGRWMAGRRPNRRVGTAEGPGRHHAGADTRADRSDLTARRPATGQGAVADAVRDRGPRRGDPRPERPRPRPAE